MTRGGDRGVRLSRRNFAFPPDVKDSLFFPRLRFEVITRDEEGDENGPSLRKLVSSNRYDVQGMGITVVISIGTLKVGC